MDGGVLGSEGVKGGLAFDRGLGGHLALAALLLGGLALGISIAGHGRGRVEGAGEKLSAAARRPARGTAAAALAEAGGSDPCL
jgi:hypothetical protein